MKYLLYDFLQVAGGAERLTLCLAKGIPELNAVVSRIYPAADPLLSGSPTEVLQLANPVSRPLGRILEAVYCFRRRTAFLSDAEAVVYSGYYAPMAVHNQRSGRRIYYCHTPPRLAFDQFEPYRRNLPRSMRWAFDLAMTQLRRWYTAALGSMDVVLANSENVRHRLHESLGIDATVVHPPIDVDRFRWLGDGDYYVSLARLVPYKRVDLIVEAFRRMPTRKLIVASGGPELPRLRQLAGDARNIRLLGWLSESELAACVGNAKAAIYVPVDEDFGMSPVEAMAAGKPVIGVAEGGVVETVMDGRTGLLIKGALTPEKLIEAVDYLEQADPRSMRFACQERARDFTEAAFLTAMRRVIDAGL